MDRSSRTDLAAIISSCVFPWVVLLNGPSDVSFVMSWGLVNTNPFGTISLLGYLGATQGFETLPWSLQVWPISLGLYCGAVASAASGVFVDREDPRLTAGLLVLSTIGSLIVWQWQLSRGVSGAIPVGVVSTAVVVWWFYWPILREHRGGRQWLD